MNDLEVIRDFPKDFIFGTATSSYQIEGSMHGGCGLSHWDTFAKKENATFKGQDGGRACEHIFKWKQDLDLVRDAGFSAYRFSFSWPRIQPDGTGELNTKGISFYDELIDGMLERNLLPFATLYHWDLPEMLADKGGWQIKDTAERFADYSEIIVKKFGDRLYSTATINEPWCISWLSHYWGEHAPGLKSLAATAKSMHNILRAHGKSIEVMRSLGQENLGIVLNKTYVQPLNQSDENIVAANLYDDIHNLWFDEAIFKGRYPKKLLNIFGDHMPENYQNDMDLINQSLDWVGVNYYTRSIVKFDESEPNFKFSLVEGDLPKTDMGWEIFPNGLSNVLRRLNSDYSKRVPIHITENGMANAEKIKENDVDDKERIIFYLAHLKEIEALLGEIPIKSYFAWSLLDNYEWAFGYQKRFGLVYVDYDDLQRIPKASYKAFQKVLLNRHKGMNN